jgi:hypothetical protein
VRQKWVGVQDTAERSSSRRRVDSTNPWDLCKSGGRQSILQKKTMHTSKNTNRQRGGPPIEPAIF